MKNKDFNIKDPQLVNKSYRRIGPVRITPAPPRPGEGKPDCEHREVLYDPRYQYLLFSTYINITKSKHN